MKISNKFPKIAERNALLVVTGKQDAVFYRLRSGELEKVDAFKIPTPRYSDNEGFTKAGGRGVEMGSGWPRELDDDVVVVPFLSELEKRLRGMNDDFKELYLLTPEYMKNDIRETLPATHKKKLKVERYGNYFNSSPQELLEMIEVEL